MDKNWTESRRQKVVSSKQGGKLRVFHCLLPSAYCLLFTAFCFLPSAYSAAGSLANRVPNGSITAVAENKPAEGWSTYVSGGESPELSVEAAGGERGNVLRVDAKRDTMRGFWVTPNFPVQPRERLTVAAKVSAQIQSGSAVLNVGFRGKDGRSFQSSPIAACTGQSDWQSYAGTFVVPEGAETAYLTLGVNKGTVGVVRGDDFTAVACPLRITANRLGLQAARARRALEFSLDPISQMPQRVQAEFRVQPARGPVEQQERVVEILGKRRSSVRFETDCLGAAQITLAVRTPEGVLLASEGISAPPVLRTEFTNMTYRRTLFVTPGAPQFLAGQAQVEGTAGNLRRTSLALKILPLEGDTGLAEQQIQSVQAATPFRIDLAKLQPGRYRMIATLNGGGKEILSEVIPFTLRADSPRIVRVDERNNLVVDGKPFFPNGVYGGVPPEELPRIKAAGCNMVLTYESNPEKLRALLDKARDTGLRVVVSAPRPFVGKLPAATEELRAVVRSLKDAPALLGWYLDDEPDGQGKPPADVRAVHEVVAAEDPDHPTWVVFDNPTVYDRYADVCDVFMVDPYPILDERQPLTRVSDWVDIARKAVADHKPVIYVPQAFGWDVIKDIPRARYITPTPEEYRAMAYLSLAHGAKGFVAYCYHVYTGYDAANKAFPYKLGGYLPEQQPRLWECMTKLAGEMNTLAPVLLNAEREPLSLTTYGKAHEHGVRLRQGGKDYLLLVNPGEEPLPLPAILRQPGISLAPGITTAGVGKTLPRYGVLVLETPVISKQ